MAYITYTALREFEPTGYSKSGTDISVSLGSPADYSFSVSGSPLITSLAGLSDNEWALVSGFVNDDNNGWFQANGDSTSTRIMQDTSVSLVNESAGPSVSIVGYKRGLGQSYDLEFYSESVPRSVKVHSSKQISLDRSTTETLLFGREVFIDVVVLGPLGALITEAQMLQWREFLASVEGGETFTFDRYGTIASPVEPKSAQLDGADYMEERVAGVGNAGLYKLTLRVKLLS